MADSATDDKSLSVAAFAALGTLVAYLATEVSSPTLFDRVLWPTRFYNSSRITDFIGYAFWMPLGGPIVRAAINATSEFERAGLWRGKKKGDMLGSAFYRDSQMSYTIAGGPDVLKEARNALWFRVLLLLPPSYLGSQETSRVADVEAKGETLTVRHERGVYRLSLRRTSDVKNAVVDDLGRISFRHVAGMIASELITIATGVITASVWKSPFALWYLLPLLLKMLLLMSRLEREKMKNDKPSPDLILCESVRLPSAFILIDGEASLVQQFFRHYGHPMRDHRGREIVCMLVIIAFTAVYPIGLLTFIFAPVPVQWTWLAYEIFATMAMHVYFFNVGNSKHLGTTESALARALARSGRACLIDSSGTAIAATLKTLKVPNVTEGRVITRACVTETLRDQMQQSERLRGQPSSQ